MKSAHIPFRTVQVANREFNWRLHRQPQWCTADGYKGLTLYVELAQNPQRPLIVEFPFKVVHHRSYPGRQRPSVSANAVIAAISSALAAGWEPESRGKAFVHEIEEPHNPAPNSSTL